MACCKEKYSGGGCPVCNPEHFELKRLRSVLEGGLQHRWSESVREFCREALSKRRCEHGVRQDYVEIQKCAACYSLAQQGRAR
jgi:hypothetical protein